MPRHPTQAVLSLASLLLLCLSPLAAQESDEDWLDGCRNDDHSKETRERVCEVRQLGFRATGSDLVFDPDRNGGVAIEGWDLDSVAITARIQVGARTMDGARAMARDIQIELTGTGARVIGPTGEHSQSWGVNLVVKVPRKSGLRIETHNGPVSVENVSGNINVSAKNGPISLHHVGGDVHARVQNGPLSVVLNGKTWDGKGLDAEAMNGPVDLGLPDGYNAELETGTVNGPMDLQIPLTVTLYGRAKDHIRTTLGRGGPPVRVVTTNGPITIRRARS